jgi:kynureninase
VDFAFWCNYKYLNGGPGSTASLYVNRRHARVAPALRGWWGHAKSTQFDMNVEFERADGAAAFQIGTPPVLSTAAVFGAAKTIKRAGIARVRAKSLAATAYLMALIDEVLAPHGFSVGTPREDSRRGGHVALEHADAWRICVAIKKRGVIPDFRPPDVIRLSPVPLYTSFEEIWRMVDTIRDSFEKGEHLRVPKERGAVT